MPLKIMERGFTLIEVLIYIVLFSFIVGGGMLGVYQIIEGSDKTSAKTITEQESVFFLRKLNWAMTGATSVSVPTPTRLIITKGGSTTEFRLTGKAIEIGGPPFIQLTNDAVKISSLSFEMTLPSFGKPASVKTSFTATTAKGDSQIFKSTRYLRQ